MIPTPPIPPTQPAAPDTKAPLRPLTSFHGRYAEALGKRTKEFEGLSNRELAIYLAGQEDGANIKADECQRLVSDLEGKPQGVDYGIPT